MGSILNVILLGQALGESNSSKAYHFVSGCVSYIPEMV